MILSEKCLELNLPEPHKAEEQLNYVKRTIVEGYTLNTRICRFIGIHNLHSIVPKLSESNVNFEKINIPVCCPLLKTMPPEPVIVIYMTMEQQKEYWESKEKPTKETNQ